MFAMQPTRSLGQKMSGRTRCGGMARMDRILGYGPINRFSFLRSRSSFGLAWWSHVPGQMFAVLLLAISVFWHFGISVSYAAESIQKCEHDHDYEHIRQSSALLVARELSSIQLASFPSIFLLPLLYARVMGRALPKVMMIMIRRPTTENPPRL